MAQLMPNPKQQYFDNNGDPLVGGKIFFYKVGTDIPRDTWQDMEKTILNTNPVVLDARGEGIILLEGNYRVVVMDAKDNLIYDIPVISTTDGQIIELNDLVNEKIKEVNAAAAKAEQAKIDAEAARDAAILNSETYPDEPTGRAAVADGEYFRVQGSGDIAAYEYRRIDANSSVLIAMYPSASAVAWKVPTEYALKLRIVRSIGNRDDTAFVVQDINGLDSWLGASSIDGGPTHHAETLIRKRLGVNVVNNAEYMFSLTDINRVCSELTVTSSSGEVPDWVLARWKARMGGIDPGPGPDPTEAAVPYPPVRGTTQAILGTDFHERNGESLPILTDMTKLSGWGSSSMERSASAYASLASSLGMSWNPGGIGGQATPQIAARAGSIPSLMTFPSNTIPASGTTNVSVGNVPGHISQNYTGTVAGVHGRLYYLGGAKFERTTAGDPVQVEPDTPFLPDAGATNRAAVTLLWMGRNDLNGDVARVDQVIKNTDATFDWLAPLVKRSFVMGHFKGNLTPADPVFGQIDEVNTAHQKRYGERFIDVNAYLISAQVWTDTGISPTQADLDAQAVGTTPPSLLADSLHLLPAVYQAVATYCVRARMVALGWIS